MATIKLCLFVAVFKIMFVCFCLFVCFLCVFVHLFVLNITKINRYFVSAWGSATVVFTAICKLAVRINVTGALIGWRKLFICSEYVMLYLEQTV